MAWSIVNLFLLYFGMSMTDYDFREIVTKPDNVPIVGLIVLVGYFTWLSLRRAVINDARMAQGLPNLEALEPDKTLTWPDLVYTELICMVALTIVLVVWGIALQAPSSSRPARPSPPTPPRPPGTSSAPGDAGLLRPLDGRRRPAEHDHRRAHGHPLHRHQQGRERLLYDPSEFAYNTFQYGFVVLWVVLILLGTFLRGPNWNFFGPYEYWDLHKLIPLNNVNLSEIVWIQLLGKTKPS